MWTLLTFVLVILLPPHECSSGLPNYEYLGNITINTHRDEYISLLRQVENYTWHFDTSRKLYISTQGDASNPIGQFRNLSLVICKGLNSISYNNLTTPILKRQVQLLSELQINGLESDDYYRAEDVLKTLMGFTKSAKLCSYRNQSVCSLSYLPNVVDCIIRTKTPSEMEYYWTEWRYAIKDQSKQLFREYIELYRKAAAFNGHITPSRTWYLYFEAEDFLTELKNVMDELMPFYSEFHAYIRSQLRQKYGDEKISDDGPIPEHMVEQVQLHAWRQHSIVDTPYPDTHLPNVKESMIRLKYNSQKIILAAEDFYRSLGFDKLSSTFGTDNTKKIPETADDHDCKSQVYSLYPEVALRYCTKVDFRKLMQMHGTMANVFYNLQKNSLPMGLDREAFPGFGNILGEAVVLAAQTPRHLENVGLIENYSFDQELILNRLFRLGTHTLLAIPMYFSYEKFWVDALDHRIKPEDYNCAYWNIREQYAGMEPPNYRTEATLDPGYRFYTGLDDAHPIMAKLLSELMGYQIYKGLCLKTGQYIPGDENYPLYNCDFYKQRQAGVLLKKVMSLGATTSWRKLLEIITGETTLSAKPILEFYDPLYVWLKEYNEKNGITVGWEISEKCNKDG